VEEEIGVKNSKAMLRGGMKMTVMMMKLFKDGMQMQDFVIIITELQKDPDFIEAFRDLKEIPAEMRDLSLSEGMELVMEGIPYIPMMIDAMRKKD